MTLSLSPWAVSDLSSLVAKTIICPAPSSYLMSLGTAKVKENWPVRMLSLPLKISLVRSWKTKALLAPSVSEVLLSLQVMVSMASLTFTCISPEKSSFTPSPSVTCPSTFTVIPAFIWMVLPDSGSPLIESMTIFSLGVASFRAGSPRKVYCSLFTDWSVLPSTSLFLALLTASPMPMPPFSVESTSRMKALFMSLFWAESTVRVVP